MRALIAGSGAAIVAYDTRGVITVWNPATEKMLGWTAAEKIGTVSESSVDPHELAARARELSEELGRPVRPGLEVFALGTRSGDAETREWTYVAKDGRRGSMTLTVSALRDPDGRVSGYVSIGRDTTEIRAARAELLQREEKALEDSRLLRKLNEELETSNRDLEEFAMAIAHDLKEPLNTVCGAVGLLSQLHGTASSAEGKEFARYATEGTRRMAALIDDLLAFARIGRSERPSMRVDCELALDRALDVLAHSVRESGATIVRKELPPVVGDETEMVSLFQNLVGNALKFRSSAPPEIIIATRPGEATGTVEFRISDNGIGIEPGSRDSVFGVFKRLHPGTKYPGTGIGLAMCRKIVERSGGKIWVDSGERVGTTVGFVLPLAES